MKSIFYLLICLLSISVSAQSGTDIYWAELKTTQNEFHIGKLHQLTNTLGYDNQPSFWLEEVLLYASTRNEQTDVVRHNLGTGEKQWLSATKQGSEYSPLRIPASKEFSAIRLDINGLQRLYRYATTGENALVHPELKIGYHLWVNATTLICTVLIDNRMDLYQVETTSKKATRLQTQVGRSLHRIPNSNRISFVQWENEKAWVKTYDLKNKTQKTIFELPKGVQDLAWLPNGQLIFGQGRALYGAYPSSTPVLLHQFKLGEIKNISRIAISPDGKKIALVGEEE